MEDLSVCLVASLGLVTCCALPTLTQAVTGGLGTLCVCIVLGWLLGSRWSRRQAHAVESRARCRDRLAVSVQVGVSFKQMCVGSRLDREGVLGCVMLSVRFGVWGFPCGQGWGLIPARQCMSPHERTRQQLHPAAAVQRVVQSYGAWGVGGVLVSTGWCWCLGDCFGLLRITQEQSSAGGCSAFHCSILALGVCFSVGCRQRQRVSKRPYAALAPDSLSWGCTAVQSCHSCIACRRLLIASGACTYLGFVFCVVGASGLWLLCPDTPDLAVAGEGIGWL